MVRRHVAQAETHVKLQRETASYLRGIGASTKLAEELLAEFERTLTEHRRHLGRLEAETNSN